MQAQLRRMTEYDLVNEYLAWYSLVETGRAPYHNNDPGHPVYREGAAGKRGGFSRYADAPDKSPVYKRGHALYLELQRRSPHLFAESAPEPLPQTFSTWQAFCQTALEVHGCVV